MRSIVENEIFGESAILDNGLSKDLGVEPVEISTASGKLLIKGKDSLLTISCSKVLKEKELIVFSSLLK